MNLSENIKIMNVLPPKNHAGGFDGNSKLVDMSKFHKVVFLVITGATSTSDSNIKIQAATDKTATTTEYIPAKYRYCAGASSDVFGVFTDIVAATGFTMTASKPNSMYAIEVQSSDLMEGDNANRYVRLVATADTSNAQLVAVIALGYEARFKNISMEQSTYSVTT